MSNDVQRVTHDGRSFNVQYRTSSTDFDQSAVTSASVTAFMPDGRLALALLDRGPDLPGGHVNTADRSIEDTVRREAMEEAGLTLGPLTLSCVIESDYFGQDKLTYMLNYAAWVEELTDVPNEFESSGRTILAVREFLDSYTGGDVAGMSRIVNAARAALNM